MSEDWIELYKKEKDESGQSLSKQEFERALQRKSDHIIQRILRSLIWEHRFNITFTLAAGVAFLWYEKYAAAIILFAVVFPTFFYYHWLIGQIKNSSPQANVKAYIARTYRQVRLFTLRYYLYSIVLVCAGLYVGMTLHDDFQLTEAVRKPAFITSVVAAIIGIMIFHYFYMQWLYGKSLKRLRDTLKSLNTEQL